MTIGKDIVQIARLWIGTPYRHQASTQGAGADCLGLIRGVWRELHNGREPASVPPYSFDWSEPQGDEVLWRAAERHFIRKRKNDEALGDLLLFRMRDGSVAKHLGIQSALNPFQRFIHAYNGHGVVENALSHPWRRRIVARFSFPEETNRWQP